MIYDRPIVYIDESGFALDSPRLNGYSLKGNRCYASRDWQARGRVNAIGAIIDFKLINVCLFEGKINSDVYSCLGYSVDIHSNAIIIDAYNDEKDEYGLNPLIQAGSAYLFEKQNGNWIQIKKITATNREIGDNYGKSVTISENLDVVGCEHDDDDNNVFFPLSHAGSAYIFETCADHTEAPQITKCSSYTWVDGNTYTNSNNSATYTYQNVAGCDSTITLNLIIQDFEKTLFNDGLGTIQANETNASYQWLNCSDNFSVIKGENTISFAPNQAGQYAVELSNTNCTDTSQCIDFTIASLSEYSLIKHFKIYPIPTSGIITIEVDQTISDYSMSLLNNIGQTIMKNNTLTNKKSNIDIGNIPTRVYFIKIISNKGSFTVKMLKE